MTTRVLGAILLPNTPDCDYFNGEQLLTPEKVVNLVNTYKNYNIIDYEHEFTNDTSPFFMKEVGKPIRAFISDKEVTYTDLSDNEITVPPGTAFLEADITDPDVEVSIGDKIVVAYSVSVAEKEDAELILNTYKQYQTTIANKQNNPNPKIKEIHNRITQKRTNISDINNPHMFSVSVVKFPCVNKAMFCKDSIQKVDNKAEKGGKQMSEKENRNKFLDGIKNLVDDYTKKNKKGEDTLKQEDLNRMFDENNEKIAESIKSEIFTEMEKNNDTILEAIKKLTQKTEEEEDEEEEIKEEIEETQGEEQEEGEDIKLSGKGNKSFSTKFRENMKKQFTAKTDQPNKKQHSIKNKDTPVTKYDERAVIDSLINNKDKISAKSIPKLENLVLPKSIKSTFENEALLSLMTPLMREVYKASYSTITEAQTTRAILPTNVFATFVQRLTQSEPILDYVTYITGIHGKAEFVTLDGSNVSTQDGIATEHYYYDRDPELSVVDEIVQEFKTFPQRIKLNLSDRQRLSNRYGEDLVNAVLDIGNKRFDRGVAAARVYSSLSHANSKDIQFRREDGYIAQAGNKLTSGTDFDVDDILATVDTMYYTLPGEARQEDQYALFVPSGVFRAYKNYFIKNAGDRRFDLVTQPSPLYYGKIPVIESPTLSDETLMTEYNDGNATMLLMRKDNSFLGVGRETGIEPERLASNASTNWYIIGDTGAKYAIPDYTVAATIDGDDYKSIPTNTLTP